MFCGSRCCKVLPLSMDDPVGSINELDFVTVDQQSNSQTNQLQVGQRLSLVHRMHRWIGLPFDLDLVVDDKVGGVAVEHFPPERPLAAANAADVDKQFLESAHVRRLAASY